MRSWIQSPILSLKEKKIGYFKTPLSIIDRSNRQKTGKNIVELNNIINQLNLLDIYRIPNQTTAENTFFSSAHGHLLGIDHGFGQKRSFKFKRIDIISGIFSDHNVIKLETNNGRNAGTFTDTWKLSKTVLNNQWIKEETKRPYVTSPELHHTQWWKVKIFL